MFEKNVLYNRFDGRVEQFDGNDAQTFAEAQRRNRLDRSAPWIPVNCFGDRIFEIVGIREDA
ncbi:MAG: hypothetical protein IKD54_04805 [Clostridia bacterium]|nr:hypothetical protein [Clostridia bacterium]